MFTHVKKNLHNISICLLTAIEGGGGGSRPKRTRPLGMHFFLLRRNEISRLANKGQIFFFAFCFRKIREHVKKILEMDMSANV